METFRYAEGERGTTRFGVVLTGLPEVAMLKRGRWRAKNSRLSKRGHEKFYPA